MSSMLEVTDGLYVIRFAGELIAPATTERRGSMRWTEMELYSVDPGQRYSMPGDPDAEDLIRLPAGGYLLHIVGQSLVYHSSGAACGGGGVPTSARDTVVDALPCLECRPPRIWSKASQPVMMPGVTPDLKVELEMTRHEVQRMATVPQTVKAVTGQKLSTPAQKILEIARRKDPAIAAYLSGKAV